MDPKTAAATTRTIALPDEGVEALFGPYDENLRFIESVAGVRALDAGTRPAGDGRRRRPSRASSTLVGAAAGAPEGRLPPVERRREDRRGTADAGPVGRPARLLPEGHAAPRRRAADGVGAEPEPEALHRGHRARRRRLRHRPGGHGQDVPGDGAGGVLPAGEAGHPDHPRAARGRGRARSSGSCRATSRRRSTRTCGRSTTRSTT